MKADLNIPQPDEPSLRLHLEKFGLSLERRGAGYRIMIGAVALFDPGHFALSIEDVAQIVTRTLIR